MIAVARVLACAGFLLAICAAPAGAEPETPGDSDSEANERVEEPGMGQRARFEERMRAIRERGGDGGFDAHDATAAEEAARRREQAIRAGAQEQHLGELDPIEEEMFQDVLNEDGIWGGTGCFARVPDLSHQQDLVLHKRLTKDDFLERRPDRTRAPGGQAVRLHAYVFTVVSCAVGAVVVRERDDHWVARAKRADYFPMVSRTRSWWNPASKKPAADVLAHEQIHVEFARLLSEELTDHFEQGRVVVRGEGRSEEVALARFQARWGNHIQRARDELRRFDRAYDRDTDYGNDAERQAAWERRVSEGLASVRAVANPAPAPAEAARD